MEYLRAHIAAGREDSGVFGAQCGRIWHSHYPHLRGAARKDSPGYRPDSQRRDPGTPAVIHIARDIDPRELSGNLILMHCVNVSGFWSKEPTLIPEDGFNLNGDYPGRPDGTVGERIADYFVTRIFPYIDFIADLHSGGPVEPLTPCLFYPEAPGVRDQALAAAMALDTHHLIGSHATHGEYSYAANYLNIPGLLLERGSCGGCRKDWVAGHERNVRLLLQYFEMYDFGESSETCEKQIYDKTVYLESEYAGLWYPEFSEGSHVKKGDCLGHIEDMFGNFVAAYTAVDDGVVFDDTGGLAVLPGDPLVAYGLEAYTTTVGTEDQQELWIRKIII